MEHTNTHTNINPKNLLDFHFDFRQPYISAIMIKTWYKGMSPRFCLFLISNFDLDCLTPTCFFRIQIRRFLEVSARWCPKNIRKIQTRNEKLICIIQIPIPIPLLEWRFFVFLFSLTAKFQIRLFWNNKQMLDDFGLSPV